MSTKKLFKHTGKISSCETCPLYSKKRVDTNSESPSFSLKYLQDGYHLKDCTNDEKIAFLDALLKRSSLSWSELEQAPRHKLGKEKIEHSAIKAKIPSVVKEDTKLWAFRFLGLAPFVGFREGEIFHILWIDRAFNLYNHGK